MGAATVRPPNTVIAKYHHISPVTLLSIKKENSHHKMNSKPNINFVERNRQNIGVRKLSGKPSSSTSTSQSTRTVTRPVIPPDPAPGPTEESWICRSENTKEIPPHPPI